MAQSPMTPGRRPPKCPQSPPAARSPRISARHGGYPSSHNHRLGNAVGEGLALQLTPFALDGAPAAPAAAAASAAAVTEAPAPGPGPGPGPNSDGLPEPLDTAPPLSLPSAAAAPTPPESAAAAGPDDDGAGDADGSSAADAATGALQTPSTPDSGVADSRGSGCGSGGGGIPKLPGDSATSPRAETAVPGIGDTTGPLCVPSSEGVGLVGGCDVVAEAPSTPPARPSLCAPFASSPELAGSAVHGVLSTGGSDGGGRSPVVADNKSFFLMPEKEAQATSCASSALDMDWRIAAGIRRGRVMMHWE